MTNRVRPLALRVLIATVSVLAACGSAESPSDDDGAAGTGENGGGALSGGTGAGGIESGGTSAGGRNAGGTGTGGTSAAGASNGGNAAGNASGGSAGSPATGGSSTGGRAQGGTNAGGSSAGGSSNGGSESGGTSGTGGGGATCASDMCAFSTGVTWDCKKRFMYGVNFAWQSFAGDFGGYADQRGVSQNTSAIDTKLRNWAQNGVNVVRWWVWPDFRGNGVTFDGTMPTGLGGTALADLDAALELANQHDVYLMLTLFSFDGFKSSAPRANMSVFATDATRRAALVGDVIRPFARAAQASPNSRRLIAWDLVNEPEWSITGASMYGGDPVFDPQDDMQTVTHAQMETLLRDVLDGLRAESSALVTVGGAAMKWKNAWTGLDLDFHQFHIYDWVHTNGWPYDRTPSQYGVADKPVVMGEFPPAGLSGVSFRTLVDYWYENGYAGALPWQDGTYVVDYANVKSFADAHACETQY